MLSLPALAFRIERNVAVEPQPRHVYAKQPLPFRVTLCRSHLRMIEHAVLEVVHHCAVRYEHERACKMAVQELARIISEEVFSASFRKEFHAHRMHLAALHAWPHCLHRNASPVHPVRKRMARLVCNGFHIIVSAVEVGKDERYFVIMYGGAVSAALLAFC